MRCWTVPDGRLLVEETEGRFILLGPERHSYYWTGQSSAQEYLNTTTYTVENGELIHAFEAENSDSGRISGRSREVELRGLVPAEVPDLEARLRAIHDAEAAWEQESRRKRQELMDSFERALPSTPSDFVFAYEGSTVVVRGAGGVELWREPNCPVRGTYRFAELKAVLVKRYGAGQTKFRPELPDTDSRMLFNPE